MSRDFIYSNNTYFNITRYTKYVWKTWKIAGNKIKIQYWLEIKSFVICTYDWYFKVLKGEWYHTRPTLTFFVKKSSFFNEQLSASVKTFYVLYTLTRGSTRSCPAPSSALNPLAPLSTDIHALSIPATPTPSRVHQET